MMPLSESAPVSGVNYNGLKSAQKNRVGRGGRGESEINPTL